MAVTFTLEQLATRTGEAASTLEGWQRRGLLGVAPFGPADVEPANLLRASPSLISLASLRSQRLWRR